MVVVTVVAVVTVVVVVAVAVVAVVVELAPAHVPGHANATAGCWQVPQSAAVQFAPYWPRRRPF